MIHRAVAVKGAKRDWVLDADLKSAFDKIDHNFLLERLGTFPAREQIHAWLKAGVVDKGRYSPTEEGTPQGGVISPLLLNIALQGMERLRESATTPAAALKRGCPTVVVYADDLVALCHGRKQAEMVRLGSRMAEGEGPVPQQGEDPDRPDKRRFDFLSFNIRRYRTSQGSKVLTRPSRDAKKKDPAETRRRAARHARCVPEGQVIYVLNPVIRGQANYYRTGASNEVLPDAGQLPVAATLQVGTPQAPQEGPEDGSPPATLASLTRQARPVGVRRPGNRRLPPPVRLDEDRPARAGPRQELTR